MRVFQKSWFTLVFGLVLLFGLTTALVAGDPADGALGFFSNSLHHTGEGMRYWYEEQGGFMDLTGIPYDDLGCKNCHISSCDACHAVSEGEAFKYSKSMPEDNGVCLTCHSRAKTAFKMGEQKAELDVHIASGMNCSDCHKGEDVHGNGAFHNSMRDMGAVKASCEDCHTFGDDASRAHTVHKGKLDCAACHVSNSLTCLNCHFDNFLATGNKKESFLSPVQDWLLLINYEGKVTSATVQTLVYNDHKFIAYAPYFTHAIQKDGKACVDCHANEAVKLIKGGENVSMGEYKDGKMVSRQGVVPVVADQLEWQFLNKTDEGWVPIENNEEVQVQFVGHGSPLTEDQIKKMAMPLKK